MKEISSRFFRPTMAKKLLVGFLSCGILMVLIALIALSSLQRVNDINNQIIERDVPLMEVAEKMIEALLVQELYGRRALILKDREMEDLFWKRGEEFRGLLKEMGEVPGSAGLPLSGMEDLHRDYNEIFKNGFERGADSSPGSFQNQDQQIRKKQEDLVQLLKGISRRAREDQIERSLKILNTGRSAIAITAGLTVGGLFLGILIALMITRNISRPILLLKVSAGKISEGEFERLPRVRNHDELGDLSQAFQKMAYRLKSLEELNLNASPLTHLPGNIAIENVLTQRLQEKAAFAFCQLDLSNFKAFNDRYGYARGNEVIQAVADLAVEMAREFGEKDSFVGHIGGDDFVIVTSSQYFETLCLAIIDRFDRMVPGYYDPEDRRAGYIKGTTRQGQKVIFPIMTLAIAVVTNRDGELKNHVQVGEIAAELKAYAKSFPHSAFVVDRRRDGASRPPDQIPFAGSRM
jgi:GGDEF domain-containing protein